MVRCPSCGSYRVFVIVSPERRARCIQCGSKWSRVPVTLSDEPPVAIGAESHPSVAARSANPASAGRPVASSAEAPRKPTPSDTLVG